MLEHIKKILSHTTLYGFASLSNIVSGLVLLPFYLKYLSIEEFAYFSLIMNFGTLIVYIVDLGLITSIVRLYYDMSDDINEVKKLFSTGLIAYSVLSLLVITFVFFSRFKLNSFITNSRTDPLLILLMTGIACLNLIFCVPQNMLRVRFEPSKYFLLSILKSVLTVLILFSFIMIFKNKLIFIFMTFLNVSLLVTFLGLFINYRYFSISFSAKLLKTILLIGLPFWPTLIFTWLIDSSNIFFIKHFVSLESSAVYSFGHKIGQIVYYIVTSFAIAWIPISFRIKENEATPQLTLSRIFNWYVLVLSSISLFLCMISYRFIYFFAKSEYYAATSIIPIIAFGYIMYGVYYYFLTGILYSKKLYLQTYTLMAAAVLNILLNLFLVPKFTLIGSSIALVMSYLTAALVALYFSQKQFYIPYQFNRLAKSVGSVLLTYGIFIKIDNLIPNIYLHLFFGIIIYFVFISILKLIDIRSLYNSVVNAYG